MVTCFLCKTVITDLRALRVHFEYFHSYPTFRQYQCAEGNCSRSYDLFDSFRKHYITHHSVTFIENEGLPVLSNKVLVPSTNPDVSILSDDVCVPLDRPSFFVSTASADVCIPLERTLASLVAILYGSSILPRNIVELIIKNFQNIISQSVVPLIHGSLQNMVRREQISDSSMLQVINSIRDEVTSNFSKFSTEYRRLRYFEQRHTYIPPQEIVIGECRESKTVGDRNVISSVARTLQFIPLRYVLLQFFSLESVLVETLQYMTDLYNDITTVQNFIQANYWQSRKRMHAGRCVMPLFLFFDDYETSNALGSHSGIHKLGAVYISIPCLPPWHYSTLSTIFLTLLFHSSDRLQFGSNIIFSPLIDELNYLSTEGIFINIPNFNGVVHFELALIIGDNLGIHTITGFIESFAANYPCRICRMKKEDIKVQTCENRALLRCNADYEADLLEGNPANSGVKERCVWLKVSGFDLFKQIGFDVMHDILEGVGKYIMGLVLFKYIIRFKYFSLNLLNDRLRSFAYGPDARNRPVELCMIHINQCNVRLSASEMSTFIRYFSVLVGDKVPGGDSYWILYLKLREILELATATCVWNGLDAVLQDRITELNEMYLLLSNEPLKPKFHHLTHYHNAMINFGPLSLFSSMRYEAKHRLSKTSARASCNRKNITLSLSIKHQLKLNEIFSKGSLDKVLSWSPKKLKSLPFDTELIRCCIGDNNTLFRVRWLAMSSIRYKKGSVLVYTSEPIGDRNDITFFLVDNLYICHDDEVVLTGTLLQTILFDYHYYAYEVEHKTEKIAIRYRTLQFQTPHTLHTVLSPRKKMLVTLRSPI